MLGNCQWIDIIVSCLYVHCFDGPKQAQSLFTNHKIFICSKCCVVSVSGLHRIWAADTIRHPPELKSSAKQPV